MLTLSSDNSRTPDAALKQERAARLGMLCRAVLLASGLVVMWQEQNKRLSHF